MADKTQVGVRYCGGCNPRYDRVSLVKRLESFFPGVAFVPARDGTGYPAALVVHGCPTRCASTSGLAVPGGGLVHLGGWEDLLPAKKKLEQALQGQEARALSREQVLEILPHRAPMLFVDTVSRLLPGVEIRAEFYVNPELPALQGHFPGEPVFPGIFTAEAAAQAADLMMMTTERYAGMLPLFAGIREAKFRRRILPGDSMDIHVSLVEEREELGMVLCRGQIFVEGALAADLELRLAFR